MHEMDYGNIVRWNDELWVVVDFAPGDGEDHSIRLISCEEPGKAVMVKRSWVQWEYECVEEYTDYLYSIR